MTTMPSLRALSRTQFSIAQWCLGTALAAEMLAGVAGVVGTSVPGLSGKATVTLAVLALIAAWVRRQSARFADSAHDILRRLDLQDSLGRQIDPRTEADLIDDVPRLVQRLATRRDVEPYFGSSERPGVRRLLENLRESAWWTKRLAGDMAMTTGVFAAVLNGIALLTLMLVATGVVGSAAMSSASHWVSAVILFVIAQGPHHAHARYAQLRDRARTVEEASDRLLTLSTPTESDTLLIAAEYHLARQGAPVIPTLWYEYRRPGLNRLWEPVRAPTPLTPAHEGET